MTFVLLLVLFMGWLVSFVGQIALGSMSLTSTQISVEEGVKPAILFTWGVMVIEMLYLRISLACMDIIYQHPAVVRAIGWITAAFFIILCIVSIRSIITYHEEKKSTLLNHSINRFVFGMMLSAANPGQIPFWLLWSNYMLDWKILHSSTLQYNLFTIGGGIGTVTGLMVYIYAGNYIVTKMDMSNKSLHKIMAVAFALASTAQLWKMLK